VDVRLRPDAEVLCQPFGSFLSSRTLNRFDVLNRPATGLLLHLVAGTSKSGLAAAASKADVDPASASSLLNALDAKAYLVHRRPHEAQASIAFGDRPDVLKATRAEIEVTNRCNLHCSYCYAEANTSRTELSDAELLDLLQGMLRHGLRAVLFSGGEPFVRRGFLDLVEQAAQRLIVEVNTNGWFITPERATRLARANLKLVQVSLDSHTPGYHDEVRGKGSHARALRAVRLLVEAGVPTQVNCVVTATNRPALSELQAFVLGMGARFRSEPITRTGFARAIPAQVWTDSFRASRDDTSHASDLWDPALGFRPLCQAQVGYVAVSHRGYLKPCNMREAFFEPTVVPLVDTSSWWNSFYGDTLLATVATTASKPNRRARALAQRSGAYSCDLQLAATVGDSRDRAPAHTV